MYNPEDYKTIVRNEFVTFYDDTGLRKGILLEEIHNTKSNWEPPILIIEIHLDNGTKTKRVYDWKEIKFVS